MAQGETHPGKGGVELSLQARQDFDKLLEDGVVRIVEDKKYGAYIEVQTISKQRDGSGPFFGKLNLSSGYVSSDIPGDKATPDFLLWAREKMGWQPTVSLVTSEIQQSGIVAPKQQPHHRRHH